MSRLVPLLFSVSLLGCNQQGEAAGSGATEPDATIGSEAVQIAIIESNLDTIENSFPQDWIRICDEARRDGPEQTEERLRARGQDLQEGGISTSADDEYFSLYTAILFERCGL